MCFYSSGAKYNETIYFVLCKIEEGGFDADPAKLYFLCKSFSLRFSEKVWNQTLEGNTCLLFFVMFFHLRCIIKHAEKTRRFPCIVFKALVDNQKYIFEYEPVYLIIILIIIFSKSCYWLTAGTACISANHVTRVVHAIK